MHCPACGQEYSQKLNYCKRCGTGLSQPINVIEANPVRPKLAAMFWAIAVLGLGGLGLSFGILAMLASFEIRGDTLVAPFAFSLIFVFGLAGLLIWQLSRLITASQQENRTVYFEQQAMNESRPAQIAAPHEVVPSAVEHTTRQFAQRFRPRPDVREE